MQIKTDWEQLVKSITSFQERTIEVLQEIKEHGKTKNIPAFFGTTQIYTSK